MRIHTNTLTRDDVAAAATRIGIGITDLSQHGSRTHARAFEVKLTGSSPYRQQGGQYRAATWDEWGMFLAALFDADDTVNAGGKNGYPDADTFHHITGERFRYLTPAFQHARHKWEYTPLGYHYCVCGAELHRRPSAA